MNTLKLMSFAAVSTLALSLAAAPFEYVITPDHTNHVYRLGETASYTVKVFERGGAAATAGVVRVTLDNFGPKRIAEAKWDLGTADSFTISGALDEPGFLRLQLKSDKTPDKTWSVAYEPEKLVKGSPSPADFDQFWEDAVKKYRRQFPGEPELVKVPEKSTADFDYYRISLPTYGRRVHGYLSVPKDASKAPYPVEIGVNAAGFGNWTNTMTGDKRLVRMQFSVYPFEPDWDWEKTGLKSKYDALNDECRRKYSTGYASSGIADSREDYFFYPVLLGVNRAVDWVVARPDVDRSRVYYSGTSQGGGFGFYLTGLNHSFTRAAFFVPAITDTMGYLKGRKSGWPSIIENNSQSPERRAAAERNAPYFDGANFASRIRCPVRVAVGFSDTTCAPCAVYAAYNEIKVADKRIVHGLGMTHGCFPKYYNEFESWLRSK